MVLLIFHVSIFGFAEKKDFDVRLKILNKKVSSNKTIHAEAEKKLTDLSKRLNEYQKKDIIFC